MISWPDTSAQGLATVMNVPAIFFFSISVTNLFIRLFIFDVAQVIDMTVRYYCGKVVGRL